MFPSRRTARSLGLSNLKRDIVGVVAKLDRFRLRLNRVSSYPSLIPNKETPNARHEGKGDIAGVVELRTPTPTQKSDHARAPRFKSATPLAKN